MKKVLLPAAVIASCLLLNGCATLFGNSDRVVSITSQPSGAEVFLNGQPSGYTPTQITLADIQGNYIQLQKPGYSTTNTAIQTSFQKVGILNIFFWPGFLVDYMTGDMMRLTNPNMVVQLQPLPNNSDDNSVPTPNATAAPANTPAPTSTISSS